MSAAELNQISSNEETAIEKASQESTTLHGQIRGLVVIDQGTHDLAVSLYKAAIDMEKAIHDAHDPVCDHWNKLHKQATENRKNDLDRVVEAKKLAKKKGDDWELEQERKRLEEERRIQAEARKKAEEDARIIREAAEAERKRLEAIEEEKRLRLAQEAEETGATSEQVSQILDTPLYVPEPEPIYIPEPALMTVVAPTYQKASGVSMGRWKYSANISDIQSLVKAASVNSHFLQYLQANESAINALARATKDAFRLPGCTLKRERV